MSNPTPQGGEPLWTQQRLRYTFAKVAKADGTVGADEIMLIINGIIGEYEVTIAAQAARIDELEQVICGLTGKPVDVILAEIERDSNYE